MRHRLGEGETLHFAALAAGIQDVAPHNDESSGVRWHKWTPKTVHLGVAL